MKRVICAALVLAGLSVSSIAVADTVSVPCEEFVQTTGKRLACDKMPVIKMPAKRWEQEKAAAAARSAPDADVAPWQRKTKTQAQPSPKSIGDVEPCSVPPWKRPEGAKCD